MEKKIKIGEDEFLVEILSQNSDHVEFEFRNKKYFFRMESRSDDRFIIKDDNNGFRILKMKSLTKGGERLVQVFDTETSAFLKDAPLHRQDSSVGHLGDIKAPMPGKIFNILVKEGAEVSKGDPLIILEAMKMEHSLKAAADGIVDKIHCEANELVAGGKVLLSFKAKE